MKKFNLDYIRTFKPCYDPSEVLDELQSYTILDITKLEHIKFDDVLWLVMRPEFVSEKLMRLFAVWCARQVQHLMKDSRSVTTLDVAERFANGEATGEELDAAGAAAWAAARDAAETAAWAAAGDVAWAAAWDAAWAAARDAARDAARAAARAAQRKQLIKMIEAGIETGDVK